MVFLPLFSLYKLLSVFVKLTNREVIGMNDKHHQAFVRIGLNILYYRKQKGLTQQKLAEITSYSKNHIQKIETATAAPSVEALLDIADALDVSVSKLMEER